MFSRSNSQLILIYGVITGPKGCVLGDGWVPSLSLTKLIVT